MASTTAPFEDACAALRARKEPLAANVQMLKPRVDGVYVPVEVRAGLAWLGREQAVPVTND